MTDRDAFLNLLAASREVVAFLDGLTDAIRTNGQEATRAAGNLHLETLRAAIVEVEAAEAEPDRIDAMLVERHGDAVDRALMQRRMADIKQATRTQRRQKTKTKSSWALMIFRNVEKRNE